MSELLPLHDDVDVALEDLGAALGAAAAHGLLAGMACGGLDLPAARLRGMLCTELDVDLDESTFATLQAVNRITRAQLADDELGFELLLPEDDVALPVRVRAMVAWCEGFLAGFGSGTGGRRDADFPEDVRQLLSTIGDFTRAEVEEADVGDDAERDFTELAEYLRIAVLTLFLEVGQPAPGVAPPADGLH